MSEKSDKIRKMPDLYTAEPKKVVFKEPVLPSSTNPLNPFVLKPLGVGFENQQKGETIILLLRRHWITNLSWIVLGILCLFVPLFFGNFPPILALPPKYKIVIFIGWYLILIAFVFEKFLVWFFNVAIITNKRVVDVDFYGLLYKEITDAELKEIQDVTQKQVGAIRTIFNFGNVFIQTAGEKAMIEFEDIPYPDKVVKILQELR